VEPLSLQATHAQGHILDMLRDCNTGIRWILGHAHQHGGDPANVFLVGQSCGAQLASMALLTQARARAPACLLPACVTGRVHPKACPMHAKSRHL
jgi:acetyl esterase/lipase